MHINNLPVRWAGQRSGANYGPAYPGEHVETFLSLRHAAETLADDPHGCAGDTYLLWSVSPHDSHGEVIAATRTDAAHADRLLTLGPRGGVKIERV